MRVPGDIKLSRSLTKRLLKPFLLFLLVGKKEAVIAIRKSSQALPSNERLRFIEIVERELQTLHEGNIARHQ